MTTTIEGAELTQIGPGTAMGQLMRQYWLPALKSSELERDGDPLRLMLLGEKLIAFRDSAGRVGVMDHRCPHRCASLFLGRNEEGGIRCIYHGWKYDVAGNCIDMPSVPADQDFKHKVKAKAYRVVERAGLVWVYMGERAEAPPLPGFEVLDLPPDEINVSLMQRDCNWLQALEGEIDTAHFGFLHGGHVKPEDVPENEPFYNTITNRAPEYHVADAPWGTQYAGYRSAGPGRTYWRFANFLFPFWSQAPNGEFDSHMHARGWVPLDDGHTMFVFIWWKHAKSAQSLPQPRFKDGTPIGGTGRGGIKMSAQHHRLARPLAHGDEREQRLGDRPRGAAPQGDLQRHRRHPPAGPGDHREHGPGHRFRLRASRALGPDDHPHAPPPAAGRPRAARQGRTAGRRRRPGRLSGRAQRLLHRPRRPERRGGTSTTRTLAAVHPRAPPS